MYILEVFLLLTTIFTSNLECTVQKSTTKKTWSDSIQHCKENGGELLTPLATIDHDFLKTGVTEVGHYWTSLHITNNTDLLGWSGIRFYEQIWTKQLSWKPGKRPTAADEGFCVAMVITKLAVVFYPEECGAALFSYCRDVDATSLFTRYVEPVEELNVTAPFVHLNSVVNSKACAYECIESDGCVAYTYLPDTQKCMLFDVQKVDQHQENTWIVDRCIPVTAPPHSNSVSSDVSVYSTVSVTCTNPYTSTEMFCLQTGRWTTVPACTIDTRDCALGDLSHEGLCYRFSSSPKTWHDANVECEGHAGHLLEINDAEKMTLMDNMLFFLPNETFWTGASDEIETDWWHWSTSYSKIMYTNWHMVSGDPTGHCVQLKRTWNDKDYGQFYFDDADCQEEKHFICEIGNLHVQDSMRCEDNSWCRGRSKCSFKRCRCRDPYSQQKGDNDQSNTVCERGWENYSGYGLSRITDDLPQDMARKACLREGGSLMAPVSFSMITALTQYYIGTNSFNGIYFWSSLKRIDDRYEDEGFQEFADLSEDYLPWRKGFTTDRFTPGSCVIVEISKAGPKLFKAMCYDLLYVLCAQVNLPVRATVELKKAVSLEPMKSLWTSTSNWCAAECLTQSVCTSYGYIATSHTCHLFNNTAGPDTTVSMDYWTRSDCVPLTSVFYGAIASGSGLTAVNTEVSYTCDTNYHNVSVPVTCQTDTLWSQTPMCVPDNPCPYQWDRYGTSCYLLVETKLEWSQAATACEDNNGYLVEINTEKEKTFIINFLDFDKNLVVWTGGNDIGLQHWYRWRQYPFDDITVIDWYGGSNGTNTEMIEPIGYYRVGEDTYVYEDCIQLKKEFGLHIADHHYYSDEECDKKQKFLCETKVINVGSPGCAVYTEPPCKGIAECINNECRCPYETHRQTGQDGKTNTTCDIIKPVGGTGCKSRDELCHNISVCSYSDKCLCPEPLVQNGQDNSFATQCETGTTGCLEDWRGKGNKCYKMFGKVSYSQLSPDQDCVKMGGTLASPVNQELNEFLLLLGNRVNKWISLHGREKKLLWGDRTLFGEANNYTNFRVGTGENVPLAETCVYLSMQGTWVREKCYTRGPPSFICEQPRSCPPPPSVTNAVFKQTAEFLPVGKVHQYECKAGYITGGTHTGRITCRVNTESSGASVWDTPPTCVSLIGSIFGDATETFGLPLTSSLMVTDEGDCAQSCYEKGEKCVAYSFTASICQLYTDLATTSKTGYTELTLISGGINKKRTGCPPIQVVKNSAVSVADRSVGSTANYACTPIGRATPGSDLTVSCQSNGFWEDFPECRNRFNVLHTDVTECFSGPEVDYYNILTLEDCEMKCIQERTFRCLSLRYSYGECFLYADRLGNKTRKGYAEPSTLAMYAELIDSDLNEFHTYFNMEMTTSSKEVLPEQSMEECAQACLAKTDYDCLTIVYDIKTDTCSLYDTEVQLSSNTQLQTDFYLFSRHFECESPSVLSGMTFTDVIRKVPGRYSVGDQIHYKCDNLGEDLTGENTDGIVHCQQGGMWSRLPLCRNLCETGWYFKNGRCYQVFDDLQPFKTAHTRCLSENAALLNVEMSDEILLVDQIRQANGISSSEFWLGLYNDLGQWTWTDRFVGKFEALGTSLPTPAVDSAVVADVSSATFTALVETQYHRYVCKKALPQLQCPADWYYFDQMCYHTSPDATANSYTEAEAACVHLGATLATPHNVATEDSIRAACQRSGVKDPAYLGLRRVESEDWRYVDGSVMDYKQATGVAGVSLDESCYLVGPSSAVFGACDEARPYICQAPLGVVGDATEYGNTPCVTDEFCQDAGLQCIGSVTGETSHPARCRPSDCPINMRYERGRCFFLSNERANYVEATATCGKMGGRVASMDSLDENQAWFEFAERQHGRIIALWVGYDYFVTGTRLKTNPSASVYKKWAVGQPSGSACVAQSERWDAIASWMARDCEMLYHYVCEVDITTDRTTHTAYYKGCFSDDESPFSSMVMYLKTFSDLDIFKCRTYCTEMGFKYAGMKKGTICGCGNIINMAQREDATRCNTNCAGNSDEKCGGSTYFSVYRTTDNECSRTMPSDPAHPQSCYSMSLAVTGWWDGRYSCGHNGGDLVSIQSLAKQKYMFEYVFTEPGSSGSNVSVGVYQKYDSKQFNYYTTDNKRANWKYYFTHWSLQGKEWDSSYLECAMSDVSTGEWKHGLCQRKENYGNFVCEYKEKVQGSKTGSIWRRMMLETSKSYSFKAGLVKVTDQIVTYKDKVTTFNSYTLLYCNDLDLGCLNNHQLCPEGFTLMFLIFIDIDVTSDVEIMATGNCLSTFAVGHGFCIYYKAYTSEIIIKDVTGNVSNLFAKLSVVKARWYHVAIVFDGSDTLYAYLDGGNVQEFVEDTVELMKNTLIYDAILLGNWHQTFGTTSENNQFRLHDVRFKPQKLMWNEITNLYSDIMFEDVVGSSHWLKDNFSYMLSRKTLPDPGVDGRGMRFNQQGAVAFLSDSGNTCAERLDQCSGDFTFAFWILVQTPSSVSQNILDIGDVVGGKQGLQVELDGTGLYIALVLSSGNASGNTGDLSTGNWHHITLAYEKSVSLKVYINTVLKATLSVSASNVTGTAPMSTFVIGHVMCPHGWVYAGMSCYYMEPTPARFWSHVRQSKSAGAHIIHIDSDQEYNFLQEFMDRNSVSQIVLPFFVEGVFNLRRYVRVPGGTEDYFSKRTSTKSTYYKLNCQSSACAVESNTELMPAVYEIELDQPEFPVWNMCPKGWKYFGQSCYKHMGNSLRSGVTALQTCQEVWAYPVEINSQEELRFVANLTYSVRHSTHSSSIIVGLMHEKLVNGSEMYVRRDWSEPDWGGWEYKQPSDNLPCVKLQCDNGGCHYEDVSCTSKDSYTVCERETVSQCGRGWIQSGSACYYKHVQTNGTLSTDFCQQAGYMTLVVERIDDMERLLLDLDIGDAMCLTDAVLIGNNYTWVSTDKITYFDKDITSRTEPCISLTGKSGSRGFKATCAADCIICQQDLTPDFSMDNIHFYETAISANDIYQLYDEDHSIPHQLSCPMATANMVSSTSVSCEITDDTTVTQVTLTGSGDVKVVPDTLDREALTLGSGLTGSFFSSWLDVTSSKRGFTIAFWVYVFEDSESVLLDSNESGNNGVKITYTNRTLTAQVTEPNYVWSNWIWFPVRDWTYVTLTWQETLGLSLFVNSECISRKELGVVQTGYNTALGVPSVLKIAQHVSGSEVMMKDFIHDNKIWSDEKILTMYDAGSLRYSITFDDMYKPNWDNLPMIRNDSVTSLVWRNSFFFHSLYVNNPSGDQDHPAAISVGQMRKAFTRLESSTTALTISFWLQPINFRNPQTYIIAYTPSPMGAPRSVSWEMTYDNNIDQFYFKWGYKKTGHTFIFSMDFMQWSHIQLSAGEEVKLFVNGVEQTAPIIEHLSGFLEPVQPFSYLEIGSVGQFEIDDIQFYASYKQPSELYFLRSCHEYKLAGFRGKRELQVGVKETAINTVICEFTTGPSAEGMTLVSHDKQGPQSLPTAGGTTQFEYTASTAYLQTLREESLYCSQKAEYHCIDRELFGNNAHSGNFWTSLDSSTHNYWAGGDIKVPFSCACHTDNSCQGGALCNCDAGLNDGSARLDEGYFSEREHLPVMSVTLQAGSGTARLNLSDFSCESIGYNGVSVTFEEDNDITPTSGEIVLDYDVTSGSHTYEEGIDGTALRLDNQGFTLSGTNARCLKDLSSCKFGFSFLLWMKIEDITNKIHILELGQSINIHPGLAFTCEAIATDSERVSCITKALGGVDKTWTSQFLLQRKRWMHVGITWNQHRGLKVYLNGHDLSNHGVDVSVSSGETLIPLTVLNDIKVGYSAFFSGFGVWTLDNLWIVERDLSVTEVRKHFGHEPACVEGWVYNNVTDLCYNMTEGTPLMSHDEAESYCNKHEGTLATEKDESTHEWLVNNILGPSGSLSSVHVGLAKTGGDGNYRWSDGRLATHLPTLTDSGGSTPYCGKLQKPSWMYKSIQCESKTGALCQRQPLWLPNKEISIGKDSPRFNYTSLSSVDGADVVKGLVGVTNNFLHGFAIEEFADECLNNIRFCHNGWSLLTWLYLQPAADPSSRDVLISTQLSNNSYGVCVYGQQDVDYYYISVVVDDGWNETWTRFEVSTYLWTHLYVSVSMNTSDIVVFLNGMNNTFIQNVKSEAQGVQPSVGTFLPFSIGTNFEGGEELTGTIDEFEVFEHELLDLETVVEEVSAHRVYPEIEHNFDFNDLLRRDPTTKKLAGKFGYAIYLQANNAVTDVRQFAFDCFGSLDMCPNGFTMMMWIKPQKNESTADFGIMSVMNKHRGFMISYFTSHPVYTSKKQYYWLTVRDTATEYNFPFHISDWFWSHILFTWRKGNPVLFVNGYISSVDETRTLSGDSYPVNLLHFGKTNDRVTSFEGFSGGLDDFLFWQQSVTDALAVKLYLQRIYIEYPLHWNTSVSGLTGDSVTLTAVPDYLNLTSNVITGSCYLHGGSCIHGMTISIIFRFLGLNDHDQTLITTGGDTAEGTGIYLRVVPNNASMPFRRYFQFGVRTTDKEYSVSFHLRYHEWTQVIAQFHPRESLKVFVDKQFVKEDHGTSRTTPASGAVRHLLVGRASVELKEKPNFEIQKISLWDKAVDSSMTGQVEDYMHFVHHETDRKRSVMVEDIPLSDCYDLCSADDTECNSFSFCPKFQRGNCYLLLEQVTVSGLAYTDECDAFIPVKIPYLDFFRSCISDTAITFLTIAKTVNNWEQCRILCHSSGSQYAGVFNGTDCYCDDSLGDETHKAKSNCDLDCTTIEYETCGGVNAVSVYDTGSWHPFIAPLSSISLLEVMADPALVVSVSDVISLTMTVNDNTYAGYHISTQAMDENFYTGFNTTEITVTKHGHYTLKVRALNEISYKDYITEVFVYVPLSDLRTSYLVFVKTAEVTEFTVTVTDGTNITCEVNYGDGNQDRLFHEDDVVTFSFSHSFSTAGVYNINITCYNNISSISKEGNIIVQDVITNLKMTTNTPVQHPDPLNTEWSVDTGTNVTFKLILDDMDTNLENYTFGDVAGSAILPQAVYNWTGQHEVVLRVFNLVSEMFFNKSVIIEIPIDTVTITPSGTFHIIDVPVRFTVTIAKGSNLSIGLQLDDSTQVKLTSASNSVSHVITYLHSYNYTGEVKVNVTISNIHGVVSKVCTVIIEVSVADVVISADDIFNPVDYELQVLFEVSSTSKIPTNALIDIDFGDSITVSNIQTQMPSLFQNITHKYATHSVFPVYITIYNNVSTKSLDRNVKVGGPIDNFSVSINRMFIPFGSPLIITVNVGYGSLITYQYKFGDGMSVTQPYTKSYPTAEDIVLHTYNDTLDYDLTVSASNSFNSDTKMLSVHVQERVEGLILTSNAPVRVNTAMTFILTMISAGTDTCFVWDFGDGTKLLYGVPTCPSRPEYVGMKFTFMSGPLLTVTHMYNIEKTFNVSVNSSNEVSWDFVSLEVSALEYLCIEPQVQVLGITKNATNPVVIKRSRRIKISANIDTQCVPPVNTVFKWLIQEVSLSETSNHLNVNIIKEIASPTNGLPSMTIPGKYLDYGVYKISLRVSYEKGSNMNKTDFSFIKIVPSKLVVSIVGDYYRTVFVGDDLVLNASSSYDPDFNAGTSKGLAYKWYCRLETETLLQSDGLPLDVLSDTSPGCFGNGFGFLGQTSENLVFPSSNLTANQFYVFTLVISKDSRVSQIEQRVKVLTSSVTPISIRCIDNCGLKVSRNQPLRLASVCDPCTLQDQIALPYQWELFTILPDNTYLPVNITSVALTEEIENKTQESGVVEVNLMIKQGLFNPGTDYRIRLSSDNLVTEKQLIINYPPYGGQCYCNRQLGMEFETKFMIFCENWLDEGDRSAPDPLVDRLFEEPITFKISYQVQGSRSEPHVFYEVTGSRIHTPELMLRSGLVEHEYMVDIYVSVADSGGAYNVTVLSIKIIPNQQFVMEVYNSVNYHRFEAEKDITAILLINMGVIEKLIELKETANSSVTVTVQMTETVIQHVAEHADWVETPAQVELVVDIMEALLQEPSQLSYSAREQALSVYKTVIQSLDRIFNESTDSVTQQKISKAMMGSFIELMLVNSFPSNCVSISCGNNMILADATQSVFESRNSLVRLMLKGAVGGEPPIILTSRDGQLTYYLQRAVTSKLTNTSVQITEKHKQAVEFPDLFRIITTASIDLELMESPKLQIDPNDIVQSQTTSVSLYNKGTRKDIRDLDQFIRISIYSATNLVSDTIDVGENYTDSPFYIEISLNRSDVNVIVQLEPEDHDNSTFEYFVSYNTVPTQAQSEVNGTLPLGDESETNKQWRLVFDLTSFTTDSKSTKDPEKDPVFYIGLMPLHDINTTSSVLNVTIFTAGCQYWDIMSRNWKHDGLSYGSKSDKTKVECLTSHLTSFGASFFVPPNTINFQNVFDKFADLGNNAAVFSTVVAVIALYLIVVFFVRRADKKDVIKWSVLPLLDNMPSDVYHYQVTVFTGMRRYAGTKSRVFFVLGGEDGDTEIRAMEAEKKKQHERGSVNSYILSVPQPLGHLLFLRIWHDNSGKGIDADWYLSLVMVKDIQTDQKYVFLCDRWLAVDKDDGKVERFMPVSTREDLESFSHLFGFKARQDLTDGHLWFSVASRPTWSNFTRVQRLSCCLSLLFTTMVANAMWYGTTPSQGTQDVHLGPFTFSPQELTTSLLMSLIVVPVNLLIVTLFRKAGPKPAKKCKNRSKDDTKFDNEECVDLPRTLSPNGIFTIEGSQKDFPGSLNGGNIKPRSSKSKPCCGQFPHWVSYIAWFLVFVSIVVPAFFTILYSLEWGSDKSSRWLTSFVLSFIESVVLIQPIKVLVVALVLALIFKKMDIVEEGPAEEQEGETIVYSESGREKHGNYAYPLKPAHRRPYVEKPPDFSTIANVRNYREKQNRLVDIIKDVGTYVFYLIIVAIICYENRDENSFRIVDNIRNLMVKDIHQVGSSVPVLGFEGISSFDHFWDWSVDRLLPALYLQNDFKGDSVAPRQLALISDHINYRVGPPRLRQARVLKDTCKTQAPLNQLIKTCIAEYGVTNFEDESYDVGWTPLNTSASTSPPEPWLYKSVMELTGIPAVGDFGTYGGGGYVAILGNDNNTAKDMLMSLKNNKWIDRQTRAVFLELNLYNPYVNLFCAVSLLLEIPPTGSAISYTHITPLRLYRYVGPSALFMIVTDLIFVAFTVYFLVRLVREIKSKGRKYLHQFWNFIEFFNVLAAILCCAFYGVHYIMTAFTLDDFHNHPGKFVNFQRIVLWDDTFATMQGFLLFFSMIKLLRLIRFNAKITQLSTTLRKAVGPIFNFFIVFFTVFMAFTQFAYLVFGPVSSEYFSFLTSLETLFSMLLMKVNIEQVINANNVLGPLFLFLFILVVVFILLNMLLSILNEVFTEVRLDKKCRPDDPEMVTFMISEMKKIIGITETAEDIKKNMKDSKAGSRAMLTDVERWLADEKDRFPPEPLDTEYETAVPPNSTDLELRDITKRELYMLQSKDWLRALKPPR